MVLYVRRGSDRLEKIASCQDGGKTPQKNRAAGSGVGEGVVCVYPPRSKATYDEARAVGPGGGPEVRAHCRGEPAHPAVYQHVRCAGPRRRQLLQHLVGEHGVSLPAPISNRATRRNQGQTTAKLLLAASNRTRPMNCGRAKVCCTSKYFILFHASLHVDKKLVIAHVNASQNAV